MIEPKPCPNCGQIHKPGICPAKEIEAKIEDKEIASKRSFEIFKEVSNAGPREEKAFRDLLDKIGPLPKDIYAAGVAIRGFLIREGFVNDDKSYQLQDVLKKRRGNCLSLTLLYGSILEDQGFKPEYEILLNPRGIEYKKDIGLFESLTGGKPLLTMIGRC